MPITPEGILESLQGKGLLTVRKICFDISRELTPEQTFKLAQVLYRYENAYGPMAAALLAGHVSFLLPAALQFMKETVSQHPNIKVQDCLAKALDHYCLNVGYGEKAFATLKEWGKDTREFARRAAVEAPRPWMKKDYFKENARDTLNFVLSLIEDPSPFVRFSVSNVMGEMRRDAPDVVGPQLLKIAAFKPKLNENLGM